MPTIIDSLLVKLGLDSSEFDKGKAKVRTGLREAGDEADKAGRKLHKAGKDGAAGFNEVAKSAVKFLAIIGGTLAVKRFIADQIEAGAAIDRLSRNLKEGVDNVSAWSNAAELAGGSAEGLQSTMDMLSKSQTELQLTGQSGLVPFMAALGVSMTDVRGKAAPVSEILLSLSERFAKLDRTTANNMGRMMGIDQGTMHLLLKGRSEVELTIKRQKEYNAVSAKQAEDATRLSRAITEGKQSFAAFGRELLGSATPALEKLLSMLSEFGGWVRENQEFVRTFLSIMAVGLGAVAAAAIPVNLAVAAVLALGAGIALLWQDYQTWKRGGDSLIDWGKWEPGFAAAGKALVWLRDLAAGVFFRIAAAVDAAQSAFAGDWGRAKRALASVVSGDTDPAPTAPAAAPASAPRGVRNNNPGNLNYAGQAGATKEAGKGGRFAVFGSMQEGVAALVRQIGLYVKRGRNTIRSILEKYAPTSENDTAAYIFAVASSLGISPDAPLDPDNAEQVMGLVKAISKHENGGDYVSDAHIAAGYQMARAGAGRPGAARAAAGAGAANTARAAAGPAPAAGSGASIETNIGEVKVYTQAKDAAGIAQDMGQALDGLFSSQSTYGFVS